MDGSVAFRKYTFAGDASFIDSEIGSRPGKNAPFWEHCLRRRARYNALNHEKVDIEGLWATNAILLGIGIEFQLGAIFITSPGNSRI